MISKRFSIINLLGVMNYKDFLAEGEMGGGLLRVLAKNPLHFCKWKEKAGFLPLSEEFRIAFSFYQVQQFVVLLF